MKVCDCFLDVAVYCLTVKNLVYADFFHHCLQVKKDKRKSFMIMSTKNDHDDYFIACCTRFICIEFEDPSKLDCINLIMITNRFYHDNDGISDSTETCVNTNFDDKEDIDNFCFYCQRIILHNFSSNLHIENDFFV